MLDIFILLLSVGRKYNNNHNKEISCGGKMKKRAKIQFTKNHNPITIPNYMKKNTTTSYRKRERGEEKKQSKINGR